MSFVEWVLVMPQFSVRRVSFVDRPAPCVLLVATLLLSGALNASSALSITIALWTGRTSVFHVLLGRQRLAILGQFNVRHVHRVGTTMNWAATARCVGLGALVM